MAILPRLYVVGIGEQSEERIQAPLICNKNTRVIEFPVAAANNEPKKYTLYAYAESPERMPEASPIVSNPHKLQAMKAAAKK